MKIAVIGASGFLGQNLYSNLSKDYEVVGTYFGRKRNNLFELDATKKEKVEKFLSQHNPDVVIDTIALTSSTKCQQNPSLAEQLNYQTAKNIAEACLKINSKLFFISSSYVFDGKKGNYNEEDLPNPLNVYGKTKLMAEKEVLKNSKNVVLRVEIMYGYHGGLNGNGVFDMVLSGNPIKLREPYQIRQPLFVEDVSKIIKHMIKKDLSGIFHLAGSDRLMIIDFLKELERLVRKDSIIEGIGVSEGYEIKIPHNSTFDTSKLESLGFELTQLKQGLIKLKEKLQLFS
ncbi:SDR family oxidoreductase [Candidatus Pacearchaeota archaeon]|nr:SDR family oxidoreductase [Candidatus Pacearchaeota archaeon]